MEDTRKRETEEANDVHSSVKRPRPTEELGGGDLGDDIMAWLSMEDDNARTVGDLINFLDTKPLTRVKFIDNPYTSPLIFQSYSSYVTINGNEETCGSSFSDSESSLMVSVDVRGIVNVALGTQGLNEVVEGGGFLKGGEMDGCDGWESDDHVLSRFLGEEVV